VKREASCFRKPPAKGGEVPVEDAIRNMEVIDAIFRSAESGKWEKP